MHWPYVLSSMTSTGTSTSSDFSPISFFSSKYRHAGNLTYSTPSTGCTIISWMSSMMLSANGARCSGAHTALNFFALKLAQIPPDWLVTVSLSRTGSISPLLSAYHADNTSKRFVLRDRVHSESGAFLQNISFWRGMRAVSTKCANTLLVNIFFSFCSHLFLSSPQGEERKRRKRSQFNS